MESCSTSTSQIGYPFYTTRGLNFKISIPGGHKPAAASSRQKLTYSLRMSTKTTLSDKVVSTLKNIKAEAQHVNMRLLSAHTKRTKAKGFWMQPIAGGYIIILQSLSPLFCEREGLPSGPKPLGTGFPVYFRILLSKATAYMKMSQI